MNKFYRQIVSAIISIRWIEILFNYIHEKCIKSIVVRRTIEILDGAAVAQKYFVQWNRTRRCIHIRYIRYKRYVTKWAKLKWEWKAKTEDIRWKMKQTHRSFCHCIKSSILLQWHAAAKAAYSLHSFNVKPELILNIFHFIRHQLSELTTQK